MPEPLSFGVLSLRNEIHASRRNFLALVGLNLARLQQRRIKINKSTEQPASSSTKPSAYVNVTKHAHLMPFYTTPYPSGSQAPQKGRPNTRIRSGFLASSYSRQIGKRQPNPDHFACETTRSIPCYLVHHHKLGQPLVGTSNRPQPTSTVRYQRTITSLEFTLHLSMHGDI